MHDMGIVFDLFAVGDAHRTGLGHTADIIAPKVKQHQMFRTFLGIIKQVLGHDLVVIGCLAAPTRSGNRANGDFAVAQADKDFRAGADNLKPADIKIKHKR